MLFTTVETQFNGRYLLYPQWRGEFEIVQRLVYHISPPPFSTGNPMKARTPTSHL